MLVVIDADALVAFAYPGHEFHTRVKVIIDKLIEQNAAVLFPTTAVCEAVTVLERKLKKPKLALFVVEQVKSGVFPVWTIDQEVVKEAIELFKRKKTSARDTLFDAIVAAIAKKHNAAIFGFDHWYREIGLQLAEDLFS